MGFGGSLARIICMVIGRAHIGGFYDPGNPVPPSEVLWGSAVSLPHSAPGAHACFFDTYNHKNCIQSHFLILYIICALQGSKFDN